MKHAEAKWLVRLEEGKILGPLTTHAILQLIAQGSFSGDESVCSYPDGNWKPISSESQFYDGLLEALTENPNATSGGLAGADEDTLITGINDLDDGSSPAPNEKFNKLITSLENESKKNSVPPTQSQGNPFKEPSLKEEKIKARTQGFTGVQTMSDSGDASNVIDLEDLSQVVRKAKKQLLKLPLIAVTVVFTLCLSVYLLLPSSSAKEKINLLSPQKGGVPLSVEQVKNNIRKALLNYQNDDFYSYIEAQNLLVKSVEGSPQNVDIRGLLCLVYKELWPYTYQNSADMKTLNFVSQSTKALDPVGLNGVTCDSIRLILTGRYKEARGILESALSSFPTSPVLYQLKGEIIADDRDYRTALAYMEKASELWPLWLRSLVQQAIMHKNLGEAQKARDLLKKALQQNPKHKRALVYLGLLEHENFRKPTVALEYLSKALSLNEPLPKLFESKLYLGLAQIYDARDEKSKALKYAQKAYSLNSSNSESKELVVKLGGTEKLRNTHVEDSELVFLGDQYRRTGDCFAAQAEYKAAYESDPKNGVAALKAGQCLWELNQVQEAISYVQKAIKADPQLMEAYVTEADYYSQRFNYLAAARVLNRARSVNQKSHELWRGYALVELRRNNFGGAIGYGQQALKLYNTDIQTHIILSKAYMGSGEYKEAFRFAAKALELDSANAEAQVTYAKGLIYLQGVDSAVYYLENMITKFPYLVDYRLALAEVYQQDERFEKAKEIFQQVVDIYPKNKEAMIGLGRSQQAAGYMEEALQSYVGAAALDPSDVEALFRAGSLYLETGRYTIAIQQFERVLEANSLYPLVHYYIGKAALFMGDQARALSEAEKEKKINPNLADAYLLAADAYSQAKSYAQCAGEYQNALKLRSQGAEIYVKVARCYRKSGSLDVAGAMLGLAKEKESGYAEIYKEQGALYEMQGENLSARQAYDLYLELSPNAQDRVEIERKLASIGRN